MPRSRRRRGDAAQNFAILRRIALNLLKNEKTTKLGVASKRLKTEGETISAKKTVNDYYEPGFVHIDIKYLPQILNETS